MAAMAQQQHDAPHEIRIEVLREGMTMALYISIVLLATFVALPKGSNEAHDGVHGVGLIGLIWGTALGLALAHWFAFRVTASAFSEGAVPDKDVKIGIAQIVAAAGVAAACTVPVLIADEASDVETASWVPALILGFAGVVVARQSNRSRLQAIIVGGVVMVLGLAIAAVKNFLIGH
jgi:peptidoglycan/LPS O-acetylase OafA/YrhL